MDLYLTRRNWQSPHRANDRRCSLAVVGLVCIAFATGCVAPSESFPPNRPIQESSIISRDGSTIEPADDRWPNARSTGVPRGTLLKPSGPIEVTERGSVIEGRDVVGDVLIRADDVTIRRSRISGRIDTTDRGTYHNTLIQDVEILGPEDPMEDKGFPAVGYTNFTCERCNVWRWGKGFALVSNVTIKDSWVHDLGFFGDPAQGGSHNEAVLSLGGSNFSLIGNRFDAGSAQNFSAAVALYSEFELIRSVVLEGNLLNGGGYCLYAGSNDTQIAQDVVVRNNTFGDAVHPNCGAYGPVTSWNAGGGSEWSGNVLEESGETIDPPR